MTFYNFSFHIIFCIFVGINYELCFLGALLGDQHWGVPLWNGNVMRSFLQSSFSAIMISWNCWPLLRSGSLKPARVWPLPVLVETTVLISSLFIFIVYCVHQIAWFVTHVIYIEREIYPLPLVMVTICTAQCSWDKLIPEQYTSL